MLEEQKQIRNGIISFSKMALDATRENYESHTPEFCARLRSLTCEFEPYMIFWWQYNLVGEEDSLYRELEPMEQRASRRNNEDEPL